MTDNIYDLSKVSGGVAAITKLSDYGAYLKGFEIVDKRDWASLPQGSRICYLRNDGKFVKGGYVESISYTSDNAGLQTYFITMNPISNSSTARPWKIFQNNIEKLWIKKEVDKVVVNAIPQQQYVTMEEYNHLKDKLEIYDVQFEKYTTYFENINADYQRIKDRVNTLTDIIKKIYSEKEVVAPRQRYR